MLKVFFLYFITISLSFVSQQKETAMLYIITTSSELGSLKTRNDLSNQMFIIPKSLEIDRRKFLNNKLTSLRSKHAAVQYREKGLHLNSGDYLCVATAHLVHDKSDVGQYQCFYFVVSSNKDNIKAKAEKEVMLFVNKAHLDHITYDISQPFLPEESNYWREWYDGLREWLNEDSSEEDKKKFEEFNKKKTPKATGGVRG
jgi:hypothetical protein